MDVTEDLTMRRIAVTGAIETVITGESPLDPVAELYVQPKRLGPNYTLVLRAHALLPGERVEVYDVRLLAVPPLMTQVRADDTQIVVHLGDIPMDDAELIGLELIRNDVVRAAFEDTTRPGTVKSQVRCQDHAETTRNITAIINMITAPRVEEPREH
jgi:hypothetical protein